MRIVNIKHETIDESEVDLTKGSLTKTIIICEDATPIDNVTKFAWDDDDYEEVQMYILNDPDWENYVSPQDDTDSMIIDLEYRVTLMELGL